MMQHFIRFVSLSSAFCFGVKLCRCSEHIIYFLTLFLASIHFHSAAALYLNSLFCLVRPAPGSGFSRHKTPLKTMRTNDFDLRKHDSILMMARAYRFPSLCTLNCQNMSAHRYHSVRISVACRQLSTSNTHPSGANFPCFVFSPIERVACVCVRFSFFVVWKVFSVSVIGLNGERGRKRVRMKQSVWTEWNTGKNPAIHAQVYGTWNSIRISGEKNAVWPSI